MNISKWRKQAKLNMNISMEQIESLEEYVLISTKHQRIDCFRKEEGRWFLEAYASVQEIFQLSSIKLEGKFVDLYEDVSF